MRELSSEARLKESLLIRPHSFRQPFGLPPPSPREARNLLFPLGSLSGSPKKDEVFFWGELWELSSEARLKESPHPALHNKVDIFTNTEKILIDLAVGEPNDIQIVSFQPFRSKAVALYPFLGKML